MKRIIITAAISGIFAIICGAFGAHSLRSHLSASSLAVWHTAVEYQLFHTLALLCLSMQTNSSRLTTLVYYSFTIGIILFSGSLYVLSTKDIHQLSWVSALGPVTPFGGLLFIAGWICILLTGIKKKHAGV